MIEQAKQASDIQKKMYRFIAEYIKGEGMPPTNREIGTAMNIASTGHVDYHLTMLEKKGLISRSPKRSRGIKLISPTWGVPVKGYIAAGQPLEIFDESDQRVDVGRGVETEDSYALIVKGRSMIDDHICDGDYVVVKRQSSCETGDIVVAVHLSEGLKGSATLKRFFQDKEKDQVRLQPANSEVDPILISRSDWDSEWEVQGKVVAIFRHYGHAA